MSDIVHFSFCKIIKKHTFIGDKAAKI